MYITSQQYILILKLLVLTEFELIPLRLVVDK